MIDILIPFLTAIYIAFGTAFAVAITVRDRAAAPVPAPVVPAPVLPAPVEYPRDNGLHTWTLPGNPNV